MSRLGVVGAGAWGTALAVVFERARHEVWLWARDPERRDAIARSRRNPRLPGVVIGERIRMGTEATLPEAETLIVAVPVQHLRAVLLGIAARGRTIVLAAKGMEAGTSLLPLEILAEVQPRVAGAVLTGPNFAHEIAAGLPAAAVLAADDADVRKRLLGLLAAARFRLYGNADPIGAGVGGAAKNVVAIAAGAVIGAGLGENARAALVTRGLAELGRLTVGLGGRLETSFGLSGLGDIMLTSTGAASRNFRVGLGLGRGEAPAAILSELGGVAEGVSAAPTLVARAQKAGVEVPIAAAVVRVLAGETTVAGAMRALLERPQRDE